MSSLSIALCGLTLGSGLFLQGCGGGGGNSSTTTSTSTGSTGPTTKPTTTTSTTTTTTTLPKSWPVVPAPPPSPLLIKELNNDFESWDAANVSSPMGVVIGSGQEEDFFPVCGYDKCDTEGGKWPPCDTELECGGPNDESPGGLARNCRVSGSLVNHAVSKPDPLRLFGRGQQPGWIYDSDVLSKMLMCSYANDGGTDGRANRGCGCGIPNPPNVTVHNSTHPTPCMNIDATTGKEPKRGSVLVEDCHCKAGEGYVELEGCYHEGPALYHGGHGKDELRLMLKHRVQLQKHRNTSNLTFTPYNELVFDWLLQHKLMSETGPEKVIKAFVQPINAECNAKCIRELKILRDRVIGQYNGSTNASSIPVVGFDFKANHSPFVAINLDAMEISLV